MEKEKLKDLLVNKTLLQKEIKDSNGYILELMKKNDLLPPLEYLIEDLSLYNINYIVKNYKLSTYNKQLVLKFLTDNSLDIALSIDDEEINIEKFLTDKIEFPKNFFFTKDNFLNYYNLINKNTNEKFLQKTVEKSLSKMSPEEILQLNLSDNFWYQIPKSSTYLNNPKYKSFFKKMAIKKRINTNDISDFVFNEKDKSFLNFCIIELSRFNGYSFFVKLKGFSDFISKLDYFIKYNNDSIDDFSIDEIYENKKQIQKSLLEKETYGLDFLYNITKDTEKLRIILDDDFIEKLLEKKEIDYYDRDYGNHENYYLLLSLGLKYYIEKNNVNKMQDVLYKINNVRFSVDSYAKVNDDISNFLNNFYENKLPELLLNKNLSKLLEKNRLNRCILFLENPIYKIDLKKIKPCVNLLYLISAQYKNDYNSFIKEIEKYIIDNLPNNDKELINFKLKNNKFKINVANINSNIFINMNYLEGDNFLIYDEKNTIKELDILLLQENPHFKNSLISNDYDLNKDIVLFCLNQIDDKKQQYKSFLKDYLKKYESSILDDSYLLNQILMKEYSKEIFSAITSEFQNNKFKEFLALLNNKNENNKEKINEIVNFFSFDFIEEKLNEIISNRDYDLFRLIYNSTNTSLSSFIRHVSDFNFNDLNNALQSKSFKELFKISYLSYSKYNEKKNIIIFKNFSEKECYQLISKIKNITNLNNIVDSFGPNNNNYVRHYLIKNHPAAAFHDYQLIPNNNSSIKSYTNTEILNLFNNLIDNKKLFNNTDVNYRTYEFLVNNFNLDDNNEKNQYEYINFLDYMKESCPMMYAMGFQQQILNKIIVLKDENYANKEKATNYFFSENVNIDILLTGLKQLIDYELQSNCNGGFVGQIINQVIYSSSYEDNSNGSRTFNSYLSENDTIELIKFILNNVPVLIGSNYLGNACSNKFEFISSNIEKIYTPSLIENFILSPNNVYFQYDNYDNAYGIKSIKEVAEILLNHLQKIGQHDSLALISYNVFQYRELKGKIKYNNLDCSNVIKILAEDDKIVNMLKVINSKLNIQEILKSKEDVKIKRNKI